MTDRDKRGERPADEAQEEPSKGQYGGLKRGLGYGGGRDIKDVLEPDEDAEKKESSTPKP